MNILKVETGIVSLQAIVLMEIEKYRPWHLEHFEFSLELDLKPSCWSLANTILGKGAS